MFRTWTFPLVFVAFVWSGTQAFSGCEFCPTEVTLNKQLAECFQMMLEDELGVMDELEIEFQLINLAACAESDSENRAGMSMPEPVSPPSENSADKLDVSFMLDREALLCLAQSLEGELFQPEKIKTFEITRACEQFEE